MTDKRVVEFPKAARAQPAGRLLIPGRLRDARKAARLNQAELALATGVTRQAISAFERGEKAPEPATFQRIADALQQPVTFFTAEDRPTFGKYSPYFFRKVGPDTERRNQACEVYGHWLAQTARYFDDLVNYPARDIPEAHASDPSGRYTQEEIEGIAEHTRRSWGLGLGPISNVLALAESKGVTTCRYDMDGERVGAFSYWSGDRPFIFMAMERESSARVRYDLAHELGHLILHRGIEGEEVSDPKTLKTIEREADRFASALLMPRGSFPHEIYTTRLDAFVDLKARWKVSIQAMVYRCRELELIDEDQFTNLYKMISYRKWRTREPLDDPQRLPIEQPRVLSKAVRLLLEAGKKTPDDICADLRMLPATIETFCNLAPGELNVVQGSQDEADPSLRS